MDMYISESSEPSIVEWDAHRGVEVKAKRARVHDFWKLPRLRFLRPRQVDAIQFYYDLESLKEENLPEDLRFWSVCWVLAVGCTSTRLS